MAATADKPKTEANGAVAMDTKPANPNPQGPGTGGGPANRNQQNRGPPRNTDQQGQGGGGGGGGRGGGGFRNQGGFQRRGGGGGNFGPRSRNENEEGGGSGGGGGGPQGDRPPRRFGGPGGPGQQRSQEDRLTDKIAQLGPTIDLPPIEVKEKKFSGRCRLYIGNLTNDVTEEEIKQLFVPFGEISEVFINAEKMFAFVRVDYRANAEKAKRELDGFMRKGRQLRVRFAPNSAAVKVKNLNHWVTNELLEYAFQIFGEIERAVVIVDDRGKTTGEGIIEFARKPTAMAALRKCTEGCYFLTGSLRPVIVEPYDQVDDTDGHPEKNLQKKNAEYYKEREVAPRFATPGSFESEYGKRWKQLHENFKTKEESLKRELKVEEDKLEAQMEYAIYEHETEMLREQLRLREQDKERQKREWELKERQAEEQRRREDELLKRQSEEMQLRMHRQDEELRRRQQENSLFMQAHNLANILDQTEQALGYDSPRGGSGGGGGGKNFEGARAGGGGGGGGGSSNIPSLLGSQDTKPYLNSFDRNGSRGGGNRMMDDRQSRWAPGDRRPMGGGGGGGHDDFANKRRRF